MSEWIEWGGGKRPVAGGTSVEVKFRQGYEGGPLPAHSYIWGHIGFESDIVAYRVVGEPPKSDDGWIEWKGGSQPVPDDTWVEVRTRDGSSDKASSDIWCWKHDGDESDIVAYRIVEKVPALKISKGKAAPKVDNTKPSNPKDIVGVRKAPMSTVSAPVLAEIGVGMLEGAAKYGRHNYRIVGVRSSVYYDATMRHLMSWWEGEDIDPESGMSHITKAITSLVVLRDSQIQGTVTDDRAPRSAEFYSALNKLAGEIIDRHADKSPRHYTIADEVSK